MAPAGAWPAELVGIAQPAMRRVLARTPPEPEPGSRSRHAAAPCCTTRRGNAHRTGIAEEREVLYPWHPWAGCVVHVHQAIEKVDGTILRCSRVGGGPGLELPAWMFDRSICLAMRIVRDPYVEFAALGVLRELLANVDSKHGRCLSSNTPVSGAVSGARDQNRGMRMRRHSQRPATDQGQVRQLGLFGLPAPRRFDQPVRPGECCRKRHVGW